MDQKPKTSEPSGNKYFLGFDIGSVSLNTVILDEQQ